MIRPLALAAVLAVAACSRPDIAVTTDAAYDTAVSAEIVFLKSGKATAAQVQKLQADRLAADRARAAVVAAGGSATPSAINVANAAVAAYLADAQTLAGTVK